MKQVPELTIQNKNPFKVESDRTKLLEISFERVIELFKEYCEKHGISPDVKKHVIDIMTRAYQQKKIEYFLSDKLVGLSNKVNLVINDNAQNCIYGDIDKTSYLRNRDLYYLKKSKHTIYE